MIASDDSHHPSVRTDADEFLRVESSFAYYAELFVLQVERYLRIEAKCDRLAPDQIDKLIAFCLSEV